MRKINYRLFLLVISVISIFISGCIFHRSAKIKTVEVWCRGDDPLTLMLRDSLERKFESSHEFILSYGNKPGTLIVLIPTHVRWDKIDGRTELQYTIEYKWNNINGKLIHIIRGSCYKDELNICVSTIVSNAKIAARKSIGDIQ